MFLFSLVVACGSSDDGGDPDATVGGGADANPNQPDAMVQANCLAVNDVGSPTLTSPNGQYCGVPATPNYLNAVGAVNADAQPDVLSVELYKGFGVFSVGELVPGTYPLTGAELNYGTCGVCVTLLTDFTGSGFADDGYLATAGSVTITSVSPNFAGSVSGIEFEHITLDANFNSTPHADGCTSAMAAASFDVTPSLGANCP